MHTLSFMQIFSCAAYCVVNLLGTLIFCYRFERRKFFVLRLVLSLALLATFEGLRAGVSWSPEATKILNYVGWSISWLL
ncbi:MAG: hypothetical protein II487_02220 [Schwartzia sp.]|nr:hypothetical protein [Schwartzia sp. (in: firmicutes)]